MSIPDGHIHITGIFTVQIEVQDFICINFTQLDPGFTTNDREAFYFPRVVVVATGDAGNRRGEAAPGS